MQGHAAARTLPHLGMDPKTAPLLKEILNKNGSPKIHEKVWISSIDTSEESGEKHGRLTVGYGAGGREPKIGPELTFGITMQKHLGETILPSRPRGAAIFTPTCPPRRGQVHRSGAGKHKEAQ